MWPGNGQGQPQTGSQTEGLQLKTAITPGLVLVKQFSKLVFVSSYSCFCIIVQPAALHGAMKRRELRTMRAAVGTGRLRCEKVFSELADCRSCLLGL
jgi:hypothetical protein